MSIGERITELRKAKNISQNQIANALSISRQAVSKWETDQSLPDSLNLIKLADLLETDIEYLTTGRQVVPTRPPVVIPTIETVEKIVEKPIVQVVEKIIEREVPVIEYVEKPVIRKKIQIRYIRNPIEFALLGIFCFLLGLLIGFIL